MSVAQAEALQQLRQDLAQVETAMQAQQIGVDQLTAERDACKAGAHEASDRSKVPFEALACSARPGPALPCRAHQN